MNNNDSVFRSLEIIEKRISEKLTVENIASSVYFSKYHYGRLFREIVGDSVMEYVTKRKLTLAGRELLETNASVLDIALRFGYESHEGFTRSFKSYMGVTPTEYRKYGLTAISQKTVKERINMMYSKATDEIIRELNGFIIKARSWAASARKKDHYNPAHKAVWDTWAADTDVMADRVEATIKRVSSITDNPDEITNRFTILKNIDDIAFETNVRTLTIYLCFIGRETEENHPKNMPYYENYRELARDAAETCKKIGIFLEELAKLIIDDMRNTAKEKLKDAINAGKTARDSINQEYNYYLRHELGHLVDKVSNIQIDSFSVKFLEDCMLQLKIMKMAAQVDVFRWPGFQPTLNAMEIFMDKLNEARNFCQTIIVPDEASIMDMQRFILDNITFQCNVLLFHFRSETDKMGIRKSDSPVLDDTKKASLKAIESKINDCIQKAIKTTEVSGFKEIADDIYSVIDDLREVAKTMGIAGGTLTILANEFQNLADAVMKLVK